MLGKGEFYITLTDSRYFFPGDTVNGTVTLSLAKPTKTNCIRVIFKGDVEAGGDSVNLFTKQIKLGADAGTLDARTHMFPFEFLVDHDLNLPSSTKLKRGSITYGLTAIHERPLIPDALSLRAEYPLQILESINAEWPEFAHEAEMCQDVMIGGSADSRKVRIIAKMPRFAFVRGDIIPLELTIKHFGQYARENAIRVELIRIALFGKSKNQQPVQNSLRSLSADIDIPGPTNFSFTASPCLMVPSSTPPTIDINGKILSVQYQVRISINLNPTGALAVSSKSNNVVLEIPIVVATWPPAAVPIDLDLEETSEVDDSGDDLKDTDGELAEEQTETPQHVYVAERPIRTSSLSHSVHHNPPRIPLTTKPIAATSETDCGGKMNDCYVVKVNVAETTNSDTAFSETRSASTNSSPGFNTNISNSMYQNTDSSSQTLLNEEPRQLPSLPQNHYECSSRFPMPTPASSSPNPPTSIQSHSASPARHHFAHQGTSAPVFRTPSASNAHSSPPSPYTQSISQDHDAINSYSASIGHLPTSSLPQMPMPSTFQPSDSHYTSSQHSSQPHDHAPHYLPTNPSYHNSYYAQHTMTNMQFNSSEQMPSPSHNEPHYSAYSQPQPQQYSPNEPYYPQLKAESDPAYAPFAYPMSMPTPGLVMPTPNSAYQHYNSQYPFPPP